MAEDALVGDEPWNWWAMEELLLLASDEDDSEGLLTSEGPRLPGSPVPLVPAAVGGRRGWSSQRAAMEIRLADADMGGCGRLVD